MVFDVIIIGAGPVGLTLANLLGQNGVRVLLLEQNPTTSDIPKAIALDDEGARTIDAAGLIAEVLQTSITATGSKYFNPDGSLIAEVGSGHADFGYPKRMYFHQPKLEDILRRGLDRFANVECMFSTRLVDFVQDEFGVTIKFAPDGQAETQSVQGKFIVGCDGARSRVREILKIRFDGETFEQDWVVLDTKNDPLDGEFSRFICDPKRPVAIIPAPDGGRRYEFMMMPGEIREEILQPARLEELLAPYRLYREADMIRQAVYTFHARIADRWRDKRAFLAGDAAHITPPFAGQGMNAGFRDVHNLAWKLTAVLTGVAGRNLLDSYELERRDPCWQMIMLAVAMGDVVMATDAADVAARDRLSQALDRFPNMAEYFLAMKFKPRPRYSDGIFLETDGIPLAGSLVGAMLPNPKVKMQDDEPTLLDEVLGNGFALIAQDDVGSEFLQNSDVDDLFKSLHPAKLQLSFDGVAAAPYYQIIDKAIAAPLRTHRDQIIAVRPDRYVAGAFLPADAGAFADGLGRKLGSNAN